MQAGLHIQDIIEAGDGGIVVELERRLTKAAKGVNIPFRLLSWAFPVDGETAGVTWCGTSVGGALIT
ncbi:hypothetical protein [Streptomyces sp. NPDC097640]|uniref:hypothetical protein n=1 Tax=Streptomyces sp. NPDC097640 TaxID=3157229 RepID=UPI00332672F6